MRIDSEHLLKLPVFAEDGERVGHIVGFVLEADQHSVVQYRVCPGVCVGRWLHRQRQHERLVAPSQVLSISERRMLIRSRAVSELSGSALARPHAIANAPAPASVAARSSSSAS